MATKNDITGDTIQTKEVTDQYRANYDLIFRKVTGAELLRTSIAKTDFPVKETGVHHID